jgi:hypothetical protein
MSRNHRESEHVIKIELVLLVLLLGCGQKKPISADEVRRTEVEEFLRDTRRGLDRSEERRAAVKNAAREYRELTAENPNALRIIASAFRSVGDRESELEVLRTLIVRGQAEREDRFHAIDLLRQMSWDDQIIIDDATYQTNLAWLRRELTSEDSCTRNLILVRWTEAHPEALESIQLVLDRCRAEVNRADLFRRRFEIQHRPQDACDAVVNGSSHEDLATVCVEQGTPGWKVEVSKAILGQDKQARLRRAIQAEDVTSFVLMEFVDTVAESREETCAALARARTIELGWLGPAFVDAKFDHLKRERGCSW